MKTHLTILSLIRYLTPIFLFAFGINLTGQYGLTKLPSPINTNVYNEICPVLSYDESTLFFTRSASATFNKTLMENGKDLAHILDEEEYLKRLSEIYTFVAGKYVNNPVASDFNQDIWIASLGDNIKLYHPSYPINNALPNSICSNYSRENEYIVINEFPPEGGLKAGFSSVKRLDNGTFTYPIPLDIEGFDEKGSAINLSVSNDGQQIFLAMKRADGYGDQDLYLSIKIYENRYSHPINLGDQINTPYREATPFISQDKNRIYFASNRPGGIGGMDIYYSERLDYTYLNWSEPKLLGQPINSTKNESYPYVSVDENTIIFSTDRDGSSDIYNAKMYRDDFLDKPIAVNINIRNEEGQLRQGEIHWQEAFTSDNKGFFRTNTGQYRYILEENIPMVFYSKRRSTYSDKPTVDPQILKNKGIHEITLDLVLPDKTIAASDISAPEENQVKRKKDHLEDLLPTSSGKTIVLKNIYFAKSKPEVLEVSYPALKKLAEVLKQRPHVQVRIEGHTDNVGDKKDLMALSWARAEAIKKFLVNEGVLEENVITIGFGDEKPLNNNATEKARKENRRVEIRILKQ